MQKVLCIELGVSTIKICEMDYKKVNPKVYHSMVLDTPDNMLEDSYVRDKLSLAKYIRDRLDKAEIKTKKVIFIVASNKVLSREVNIPMVKDKQIAAVVNAQAEDFFPRDVSDHAITYTVLDKSADKKNISLLVYAAPTSLIENYYAFAKALKLEIETIDYIGNASYQWIKFKHRLEPGFFIQMNDENTIVTLMNRGHILLQRVIYYGLNTMAEAVCASSRWKKIDLKEAKEMLFSQTLVLPRLSNANPNDEAAATSETINPWRETQVAVTESLQMLIGNLGRIMEYQASRNQDGNFIGELEAITLIGTGKRIRGLDLLISNELVLKTKIGDFTSGVNYVGPDQADTKVQSSLIGCFGSIMNPVNFIPKGYTETVEKKDFFKVYVLITAGALLAGISLIVSGYISYSSEKSRESDLNTTISQLTYIEAKANQANTLKQAMTELQTLEEDTFSYHIYFNKVLQQLEDKMPSGIIVESLSSAQEGITMSMTAYSKDTVANLLIQLRTIPYLDQITINNLVESTDEVTNATVETFTVSCTYKKVQEEEEEKK